MNLEGARDATGSPLVEHRHHRRVRRSAPAAAQQLHAHGRLLAAGLRRRAARVPDLHAGSRLDEADRLEVRRTTARGCGPISTAGRRSPAWRGRRVGSRTRGTSTPSSRTARGGGSVVAFTHCERRDAGAAPRASRDATTLITTVRAQPLGAIIGSTPALMDAPSLDPPPDDDYGFPDVDRDLCRRSQGSPQHASSSAPTTA